MTTPFKVKLTIYQGSTFRWHATLKSGSPALPIDLTGCTARMQVRPDIASDEVLLTLTTENDGITLGGADGMIHLYIPHALTETITWESAVYDMELIWPNGDVVRRLYGQVVVSPEVTRS